MSPLVVMLAGGLRSGSLRSQLGFPTAGMPLDAECTLLQAWLDLIAKTPQLANSDLLIACNNARDRDWFTAESRRGPSGTRPPKVVVDPRPHRGVAGMLADLQEEIDGAESYVVIELSSLPPATLEGLMADSDAGQPNASMRVGVGPESRWSGAYRLDAALLQHVTTLGYVDLKEQFVPQLLTKGYRIEAVEFGDTAVQISDRRNYLRAVRIWRARSGFAAERTDFVSGFSVVCPGVELGDGSHVADSAVLPGAVLGEGAVVARSVIGPMIRVPDGAVIVDGILSDPDAVPTRVGGRLEIPFERSEAGAAPRATNTAIPWSIQS